MIPISTINALMGFVPLIIIIATISGLFNSRRRFGWTELVMPLIIGIVALILFNNLQDVMVGSLNETIETQQELDELAYYATQLGKEDVKEVNDSIVTPQNMKEVINMRIKQYYGGDASASKTS